MIAFLESLKEFFMRAVRGETAKDDDDDFFGGGGGGGGRGLKMKNPRAENKVKPPRGMGGRP